jgi:hypothetical protein
VTLRPGQWCRFHPKHVVCGAHARSLTICGSQRPRDIFCTRTTRTCRMGCAGHARGCAHCPTWRCARCAAFALVVREVCGLRVAGPRGIGARVLVGARRQPGIGRAGRHLDRSAGPWSVATTPPTAAGGQFSTGLDTAKCAAAGPRVRRSGWAGAAKVTGVSSLSSSMCRRSDGSTQLDEGPLVAGTSTRSLEIPAGRPAPFGWYSRSS